MAPHTFCAGKAGLLTSDHLLQSFHFSFARVHAATVTSSHIRGARSAADPVPPASFAAAAAAKASALRARIKA